MTQWVSDKFASVQNKFKMLIHDVTIHSRLMKNIADIIIDLIDHKSPWFVHKSPIVQEPVNSLRPSDAYASVN